MSSEEIATTDANLREIARLRTVIQRKNREIHTLTTERDTHLTTIRKLLDEAQSREKALLALRVTLEHERTIAAGAVADAVVLRKDFHATLTTIGGRLYTQGTGAAWQMDLLSFVRDERERLDQAGDPDNPPATFTEVIDDAAPHARDPI